MRGGEVSFDEEGVVFGVEDGLLGILPGEGLDRLDRFLQRKHQELAAITDVAPEHQRREIAWGLRVARHPCLAHVLGVLVPVLTADSALPRSCYHPPYSMLQQ